MEIIYQAFLLGFIIEMIKNKNFERKNTLKRFKKTLINNNIFAARYLRSSNFISAKYGREYAI